jgi:hypothetical protein
VKEIVTPVGDLQEYDKTSNTISGYRGDDLKL